MPRSVLCPGRSISLQRTEVAVRIASLCVVSRGPVVGESVIIEVDCWCITAVNEKIVCLIRYAWIHQICGDG